MTLDRLEANEIPAGVAQTDVLDLYKATRDVSNIRVLVPLFPEQLHIITRVALGKKEGGGWKIPGTDKVIGENIGAKDVVFDSFVSLAGRKVGSSGGSFYTAQVLSHPSFGNIPMQLVEDSAGADSVVAGVLSGKYDAGILVGAQPLPTITNLKDAMAGLKILPVPDDVAARVNKIYVRGQPLSYRAMGQGGTNIPTLQVTSSLVVQNYTKGPMVEAFKRLRQCIWDNAELQASTPGTHVAWKYIKPDAQSNWPMWQPPVSAGATAPVAKALKK
jgi:TRAP-type uncharacterized transport system substrate-binding protein